jgi:hypothetical protein
MSRPVHHAALLLICAMLSACSARPARVAAPDTAAVEALERQRFAALSRADVEQLGRWLAADLTYCHSTGVCQTRQQFLDDIRSGALRYRSIEVLAISARALGGAVLLNGRIAVEVEMQGQPNRLQLVYTDAWEQRDGAWQLVAWHSSRAAAAP